ncbi:hypothetical protein Klosneuvirus_1_402 [Klosneuvirus KNV1]|uniref:Uncharacterized protein n=1 Tax=Klosneuvirus KNV1 TaxID=1977640 RepID=A0A1V0SIJ7_9VIRU|nr:hypothetical protein Klosneuvirus_1_402 [Klosneuvirus KNV1]
MSYKQTGNKIPVTKDELINYIHEQLTFYDVGKLKDMNPYTQPIIYITKEGKMIQVPQEIQQEAVASWNPRSKFIQTQDEDDESGKTDYITVGMLILAAIIAIYLFYKSGLIGNVNVNPNTQYYLTR